MNLDDLIQYVSQESLLIGLQLKSRAFILIRLRYINLKFETINRSMFQTLCAGDNLFFLNKVFSNCKITNYFIDKGIKGAMDGNNRNLAKLLAEKYDDRTMTITFYDVPK